MPFYLAWIYSNFSRWNFKSFSNLNCLMVLMKISCHLSRHNFLLYGTLKNYTVVCICMTYSRYSGSRSGTPDIQTTTTTSSNSAPDPPSSSSSGGGGNASGSAAAQRSQQKIHFRREFANLRSRIN